MNKELMEALDILEKEKEISKETLFEAIENSLITACKNHFGKSDNVKVEIDRETCDFLCYAEKEVVEEVEDPLMQVSLAEAKMIAPRYEVGDIVTLKKQHPCGSKEWEILRIGADFRLKCLGCGHQIMIARKLVEKNTKDLRKKA